MNPRPRFLIIELKTASLGAMDDESGFGLKLLFTASP